MARDYRELSNDEYVILIDSDEPIGVMRKEDFEECKNEYINYDDLEIYTAINDTPKFNIITILKDSYDDYDDWIDMVIGNMAKDELIKINTIIQGAMDITGLYVSGDILHHVWED